MNDPTRLPHYPARRPAGNGAGTRPRSVAELMAEQLALWGVRFVFGVPGEDNLHFLDAVHRHPRLRFFGVRTESGAALMASAVAKLTGEPAVCTATSGPGVANLINGLADAHADGVPVVAITGQVNRPDMGTDSKQYVDQQALVRAVTECSLFLAHPHAAAQVLAEAQRTAIYRRKPAHVTVPRDLWLQPTAASPVNPEPYLGTAPQSPQHVIQEAARLLNSAERPAIVVGLGGAEAMQEVIRLAEKLTAPIIHTLPVAGKVPWQHPLSVGGLGEGGTEASSQLLAEADWVLRIGANWWPDTFVPRHGPRIMALDIRPDQLGRGAGASFGIVGDSTQLVPQLNGLIPPKARTEWERRIIELRARWIDRLGAEAAASDGPEGSDDVAFLQDGGIHPARIVTELNRVLPHDAIICLDVGDHVLWFNRHFQGQGQDILLSGMWRTMGFSLPAALAAKVVYPYRPVVVITGDGGLTMSFPELGTAAQYGLGVTIVVFRNGVLATEANAARMEGVHPVGTRLHNPDFTRLIESWGGRGYRVRGAGDIADQVQAALESEHLALVDIPTRPAALPTSGRRAAYPLPDRVPALGPIG